MKKVLAMVLTLLMIMSLSVTAFATEPDPVASPAAAETIHEPEAAAVQTGDKHGTPAAAFVGEEGLFTKDVDNQYYAVEDANGVTHTVVLVDGQIAEIDDVAEGEAGWDELLELVTAGAKVFGIENTYSAETEFWLNVDKYATSTGTETHGEAFVSGSGDFKYLIDYTTVTDSNISVTVPLYVCMFGFGGDGKVIVPDPDKYQMTNDSTYSRSSTVTAITEYALWNEDLFEFAPVEISITGTAGETDPDTGLVVGDYTVDSMDDYNDLIDGKTVAQIEKIDALIVAALDALTTVDVDGADALAKAVTGGYGFYVNEDDELCADAEGKAEVVSAFSPTDLYIKVASTMDPGTTFTGEDSGYKVGDPYGTGDAFNLDETALDVDVIELQAKRPGNWNIVSANTASADIRAREITLTINSVDMYDVLHAEGGILDISNQAGWTVPGGDVLNLPITSAIAGNGVNEDTHTNVLNVAYTIVPAPFA